MKKLLFISNVSSRITNFAIPSINAAHALGYEVHMAADYSNFDDDPDKYGVTIHHIDLKRFPFHPKNLKAIRQVNRLIRSEGIDVIHCNTPIGGVLGRLCGKHCRVRKVIYTAHGFHFYKGAPPVNRLIYKPLEKIMAHMTDAIITMNREDYAAAQKFRLKKGGRVFFINGVGINTKDFSGISPEKAQELKSELNISEKDTVIISAGELSERKNIGVAIKALSTLKDADFKYLICGKGHLEKELKELAAENGISDKVIFLGFRSDIPELFAISDIFLLSSIQEGLPRCTLEALASSLPCVLSDIRGNCDLIENNKGGFLCNPHSKEDFAAALSALINDRELIEKMGAYNLKESEKYDVEKIKEDMKNIYSAVL